MKNTKEYDNLWYANNKDRIRDKKNKQSRDNRKRNLQYTVDYLRENPCEDCGKDDYRVLDFDHRKSETKIAAVSDLVRRGFSIEVIQREIDKCSIRCSNCHRIKTAIELGWYKDVK